MSDYYYESDEQVDCIAEQLAEEEAFDKKWDRLEKQKEEFDEESSGLFNLLSIPNFEKMLKGTYKPKRNYFEKEESNLIFPPPYQYIPQTQTQEEIIEEKQKWIIINFKKPPCNNCRGCKRGRCCNRGKMVTKPLYKLSPEPTPEIVQTKLEAYNEERKVVEKQTGKVWRNIPQLIPVDIETDMIKIQEENLRKHEEERLRKIKEEKKKKQLEEVQKRRDEERKEAERRRKYFREKRERERNYKRQNRKPKPNSRFGNLL